MGFVRYDTKIARCKYCNQVYLINESTLYTHTVKHKQEFDSGTLKSYRTNYKKKIK